MFGKGSFIRSRRLWDSKLAVGGYRLARRAAERVGLQLVLKTYYSPIPDLAGLPERVWQEADPMRGIELDLDAQVGRLSGRMAAHIAEFASADGSGLAYEELNASYPLPDARLLYAMVRELKPGSIVELGSGQTSRVIARACAANAAEGAHSAFHAFDPFPTAVDESLPGLAGLSRLPAQEVPESVFAELRDGDVLFVDTTHTVKIGSDVNRIILRILPLLAPGVVVHFHDICLPYEYPRYLFEQYALYWAEQYLLQAFLSMNPSFEVLYATDALCRDRRAQVQSTGLAGPGESGSSFWIRRR
ncbi:MAG TPA: class I SAM-dependent methyltransferase [Solirubrobacteraceae bacterium]|nr:class I SAM-dependent methyltransferase [Solirubrobacteraceae bacterium]